MPVLARCRGHFLGPLVTAQISNAPRIDNHGRASINQSSGYDERCRPGLVVEVRDPGRWRRRHVWVAGPNVVDGRVRLKCIWHWALARILRDALR
eukprot:8037866-Lingulodinium_polyedra.AAC.1